MIEYVDMLPTFIEAVGGAKVAALDGKSFVPVLSGDVDQHKDYVFGLHTTRGINGGADYFGIRSVRGKQFKYIVNFTPEMTFKNACTGSKIFKSWREAAKSDEEAADKVRRYEHRPAEELYDMQADRFEWKNLADDPEHASIKAELKKELEAWMKDQGDLGQETELDAKAHQTRGQKKKPKKKKTKDASSN